MVKIRERSFLRPYIIIAVVFFMLGLVGCWAVIWYQESQRAYFVSWETGQRSDLGNERNCRPPRVILNSYLCRKKV